MSGKPLRNDGNYRSTASADTRYEELYTDLLERGEMLHQRNKSLIRKGIALLILLPFILGLILWITGSDKIVFLLIWVLCMFIISAYLISVEYIDDSIEKALKEVIDSEAEFDGLLPHTDFHEKINDRIGRIRAERFADREAEEGAAEAEAENAAAQTVTADTSDEKRADAQIAESGEDQGGAQTAEGDVDEAENAAGLTAKTDDRNAETAGDGITGPVDTYTESDAEEMLRKAIEEIKAAAAGPEEGES